MILIYNSLDMNHKQMLKIIAFCSLNNNITIKNSINNTLKVFHDWNPPKIRFGDKGCNVKGRKLWMESDG